MATRSNIAYQTPEGKIRSIYSHWDGYPECNGKILVDNYKSIEKIKALIELGSVSALGAQIGQQQDFDDRSTQKKEWTLAYHRDRGEELCIAEYDDIPSWIADMEEYAYLWNGKEWLVNDHGETRGGFPVFDFVEVKMKADIVKEIWGE
jgi:hypothetical protein|tara:strand:- start:660 stop:1106 length:447 start_codon:yes stop_codon:yes gene_type:complete